jgi:hypothetical protein
VTALDGCDPHLLLAHVIPLSAGTFGGRARRARTVREIHGDIGRVSGHARRRMLLGAASALEHIGEEALVARLGRRCGVRHAQSEHRHGQLRGVRDRPASSKPTRDKRAVPEAKEGIA